MNIYFIKPTIKKINLIALFMVQLFPLNSLGQTAPTLDFQSSKGGTKGDFFYATKELAGGQSISVGYSKSNDFDVSINKGVEDGWIVKMDTAGNIMWQKTVGGSSVDILYNLLVLPNGDIITCGKTFSNNGDVTGNHGSWDMWMVKLNANGMLLRSKCFGSTSTDEASSVIITYDNKIMVTGICGANDGDVTGFHGGSDLWTLKMDTAFNLIWQSTIGGSGGDKALQVVEDRDTNYLVFGWSNSTDGDILNNKGGVDYFLTKISRTGVKKLVRNYGGPGSDEGRTLSLNSDNTITMGGTTTSVSGDITNSYGLKDAWALKVNTSYNIIWSKCFGGTLNDAGTTILQTDEGGFIFLCETNSNDGLVNGNHGVNTTDFWPLRLDSSGNVIWKRCWGTTSNDQPWGLAITKQKGYIYVGQNYNSNGDATLHLGQGDSWFIKTKADPVTPPTTVVNSLTAYQLCPGNAININYNVYGFVNTNNTFTAQLSDKNGGFSAPTSIGSLVSQANGTITGLIPTNASGLNYRIRVVTTQNCFPHQNDSVIRVSCFAPGSPVSNNITVSSAKLNWNNTSTCGVGYQINYRKYGDVVWMTTATTSTYKVLSNLSPSTTYQWKVKTKCNISPLSYSTFTGIKTFTTLAQRETIEDDFETTDNVVIINVSPNIFNINFSDKTETVNIDVLDLNGRLVLHSTTNENSTQIDLNNLNKGMYIVKCYSNNYSFAGKIFVE